MRTDIVFAGNISRDKISCVDGIYREVWGGSSFNSSTVCRAFNTQKRIGLITAFGNDFERNLLTKNKLEFESNCYISNRKCNVFLINENKDTFVLEEPPYLNYNNIENIQTDILHISFRRGVPVKNIINSPKLSFNFLSIDVMIHSVKDYLTLLEKYKDIIKLVFCNSSEYQIIKDVLSSEIDIIITDSGRNVTHINGTTKEVFSVPYLSSNSIVSTTGAGDCLIGGFFAYYLNGYTFATSIKLAIRLASESLKHCGVEDFINH